MSLASRFVQSEPVLCPITKNVYGILLLLKTELPEGYAYPKLAYKQLMRRCCHDDAAAEICELLNDSKCWLMQCKV